jgi:DNA-binding cell septation regulator SpoVG
MQEQSHQNRPNPWGAGDTAGVRPQAIEPGTRGGQKKTPPFEVVDLRLIDNAGSLRAYASVKIGPLTVHDFRVIQQAEKEPWVSVPQKAWNTPQGERRFAPLLELPTEWKQPLANTVLAAWLEAGRQAQEQQQHTTGGPA